MYDGFAMVDMPDGHPDADVITDLRRFCLQQPTVTLWLPAFFMK